MYITATRDIVHRRAMFDYFPMPPSTLRMHAHIRVDYIHIYLYIHSVLWIVKIASERGEIKRAENERKIETLRFGFRLTKSFFLHSWCESVIFISLFLPTHPRLCYAYIVVSSLPDLLSFIVPRHLAILYICIIYIRIILYIHVCTYTANTHTDK